MSQSAYQSTIEDLPDISTSTNVTVTKEIFGLGLFINIAATGPCRLYVTDFTANPRVVNSFLDSFLIDEFEIPTEQIFLIDVYKEKLKGLIDEYERRYREPLLENDVRPPFRISDKICIVKATVVLKKFNNILEGRARSVRLVNEGDFTSSENLQKLYAKVCKLPKEFFKENLTRAKTVIPSVYLEPVLASLGDKNSNINENNDGSTNARSNANSNTESVINDSEPRQTYVKTEEITESMIPDTLFPNDYVDTAHQSLDADIQQRENEMEYENSFPNPCDATSSQHAYSHHGYSQQGHSQREKSQQLYYSLKQLNDYHSYGIDNEVYRVRGKILGCNPSDWSQVCIKKYEHNAVKNKALLSDPYMRHLEIILCDQIPLNSQEEVLLDSDNSITIVLDQEQIAQALNIEAIELVYTRISELNEKSFTNEILEFELYKKLVNINAKNQFLIWSARIISFDVIME